MNITKKTSTVIAPLIIIPFFIIFNYEASAQQRGMRRQGPPPEAYTVCEGKSVGDTAEFESPRGDVVTGTCEQENDKLVLRPDNPPERDSDGGPRNNDRD